MHSDGISEQRCSSSVVVVFKHFYSTVIQCPPWEVLIRPGVLYANEIHKIINTDQYYRHQQCTVHKHVLDATDDGRSSGPIKSACDTINGNEGLAIRVMTAVSPS